MCALTWKSACGRYTVTIRSSCFEEMRRLTQSHLPNEVGTSLVGCYSQDRFRAFITGLAPLTGDSRGSHTTFHRGTYGLEEFFRSVFQRFRGKRHYVGEWHSHPHGPATPSSVDDRNQLDIAKDDETDCPECILVILGGDPLKRPDVAVYVYSRTRGRIQLTPIR